MNPFTFLWWCNLEHQTEDLLKKLRRRLVAFFQSPSTAPQIIVKVAKICGIKIPTEVEKEYGSKEL
jgi:hypothetical protein